MNQKKMKQLFSRARTDAAPAPPKDFAENILRLIRREPSFAPENASLLDQMNLLFPRIALAASAVIVLCVVLDYGLTAAGVPSLSEGAAQLSAQWYLTPTGWSL